MNIHEYQGKAVLNQYGVAVPRGAVAFSVDEAVRIAEKLGGKVVVKQRFTWVAVGKWWCAKIARNLDEVRTYAGQILGMKFLCHQTGPKAKWLNDC